VRVDRVVDRLEVPRDLLALAPRHVLQAVTDQMNNTRLHDGLGEDRLDRLREPLQAVDAADQDVLHTALLQIGQDLHPELRALGLLEPHPEHVAVALDGDAQSEVAGAALHRAAFADLQHQAVEEHDRVDVLQWPLLPAADVLHDGVGDAADQVAADRNAVDLSKVRLNVAHREPTRIQREDLVVEPLEAALALAHDLRLKRALAVPWRLDPHRPVLGRKRLRTRAVAGVAGAAGRLLVRLIAKVLGQLGRHRPLHEPAREVGQKTAGPDDLLLRAGVREQLVDQLVGQAVTDLGRELDEGGPLPRARSASGSLRSPCGLAALPAGAIPLGGLLQLGSGPAVRRHGDRFRSCLHKSSDTPRRGGGLGAGSGW
jgi:hypothetical protein